MAGVEGTVRKGSATMVVSVADGTSCYEVGGRGIVLRLAIGSNCLECRSYGGSMCQ